MQRCSLQRWACQAGKSYSWQRGRYLNGPFLSECKKSYSALDRSKSQMYILFCKARCLGPAPSRCQTVTVSCVRRSNEQQRTRLVKRGRRGDPCTGTLGGAPNQPCMVAFAGRSLRPEGCWRTRKPTPNSARNITRFGPSALRLICGLERPARCGPQRVNSGVHGPSTPVPIHRRRSSTRTTRPENA